MRNENQYSEDKQKIAIPLGDPAGIGMEITLKALNSKKLPSEMKPLLIGCKQTLEATYLRLKSKGLVEIANPKNFEIENIPLAAKVHPGRATKETGEASFLWLSHAAQLVIKGQARALVTAPIAKSAWHKAGHNYPGQTELLAEIARVDNPSMLFTAISPQTGWRFNTLLATTHIPLSNVVNTLNPELIFTKLEALLSFCKKFKHDPIIAISGLNPHAGENGKIGKEETEWLINLINKWQQLHPEVKVLGPISPDICWLNAAKAWNSIGTKNAPDGILALYHDQGLIPVKLIAFDEAVNTTLGLPFIRTSPDHGTAFDIAGQGIANATSMLAALNAAWELTQTNT